jgi:hypothetical protein
MDKDVTITIRHDKEAGRVKMEVDGATAYTEILGIIEHVKMQMTCAYNKDIFTPDDNQADDDLFF